MTPAELEAHRLVVVNGLLHRTDGSIFDTAAARTHHSGDGRAMFVMDEHGNMFASNVQQVGYLHHSSFLGGRPVAGAGEIVVENGKLMLISRKSGHYQPHTEHQLQVSDILSEQGVDITKLISEDGF